MRMKRSAVVVATAALLTLAACGGSGGSNGGTNNPSGGFSAGGNAGAFKDPNVKAPMAIPAGAKPGGDVTVMTAGAPSTFDPTEAYYTDSTAILSDLVTRSLTQYKYNTKTHDMQLVPDMATNLGTPNSDNTSWTFTLRPGLKYEDGTAVKAADIAYAVKRSFAIAELPNGPTYQTTFFLDGDKYKGPFKGGLNYTGVSVSGNSITIKMRTPFADMDYFGSFPMFTAIPQKRDDPQTYGQHPLSTGPYKFASYKAGSELKLVKNTYWDPKTDPGRIQMVNSWDFKFAQDETKIYNIILNDQGGAKTTLTYDNIDGPTYLQIQNDKSRLVTGTSPCTYMWFIDMRKITNLKVRQALGWAYPYKAAWKAGGEVVGVTRVPGTAILPPGTAGRVDYQALAGQNGETTDPAKSKALLAQAGYKPGQYAIKFFYQTDVAQSVQAEKEVVKGLELGGFKADPIPSSSVTIRTDLTKYNAPVNVRGSGWCSDWPDGGSWFPAQWSGTLVGDNGMPNPSNFKVTKMDNLQKKILDTMTPADAVKAWGQFDKTMEQDYYPAVNLGYAGVAMIHGSNIGGMADDNVRGMPTLAQMYVIQ